MEIQELNVPEHIKKEKIVWYRNPSDFLNIYWDDWEVDGDGRSKYVFGRLNKAHNACFKRWPIKRVKVCKILKNFIIVPLFLSLTEILGFLLILTNYLNENSQVLSYYFMGMTFVSFFIFYFILMDKKQGFVYEGFRRKPDCI